MKKLVVYVMFLSGVGSFIFAQNTTNNNFDKKFRFGVRISPQPTWIKSKDKNTLGGGMNFGFGFGLVTEFKLSDIIHFYTGIGGDLENGTITYKNDPNNNYEIGYITDKDGALVELKDGSDTSAMYGNNNIGYGGITKRKIKTTYITIPLTLKMMTQEYSGFKYFTQFGIDLGIRTKIKADDEYTKIKKNGVTTQVTGTNTDVDLQKDASLIPIRIGLNVGLGTEYRIAGSTSLMFSINYFTSFTNLMKNPSKYMSTGATMDGTGKLDFVHLKQNLIQNALRINVGILF